MRWIKRKHVSYVVETNQGTWEDEGKEVELCVIGSKAAGFFGSIGANITGQATHIGDEPKLDDLIGGSNDHVECL